MIDFNIPFLPSHRKAWLVGGAIRDILLGGDPTDFDIVVSGSAAQYAGELAQNIGQRAVELGKAPFCIYRVTGQGRLFDIADLNGASIEEDLFQRDFSINAMALELSGNTLIDCIKGSQDLAQKKVRMVADTIFQKDPIRLLRAFRLAAVLGFQIESHTLLLLKKEAHRIQTTAAERIQSELLKILAADNAAATIEEMAKADLLAHILPEVTILCSCDQNHHHDLNAFHHTLASLSALEPILTNPDFFLAQNKESRPEPYFRYHPEQLKLALLLHDIGKPAAYSTDADGRIHFYGHEKIGAHMAEAITRRLALSNTHRRYISFIVGHHLRPTLLFAQHQKEQLSRRAVIKLFRDAQALTPDLLVHAMADFAGKKNFAGALTPDAPFARFIKELLEIFYHEFEVVRKSAPLITGRDLIKHFNLRPSPLFKIILDAVDEGRLEGRLQNKSDALRWTGTFLNKNRLNHSS